MKKNLNIAYLNGAEGMIRRGAASSGGNGESGGGDASTIEYLDVSGLDKMTKSALLEFSFYAKINTNGTIVVAFGTMTDVRGVPDNIIALGVDTNASMIAANTTYTIIEYFKLIGLLDVYNSVPRITKEEFYAV